MRRHTSATVALLLLACLSGCALFQPSTSPRKQVAAAARLYTAAEKEANDLRDQHVITEAQHEALRPYRDATRAALDRWRDAAQSGNTDKAAVAESAFTAALQKFIDARVNAKREALSHVHG